MLLNYGPRRHGYIKLAYIVWRPKSHTRPVYSVIVMNISSLLPTRCLGQVD